MGLSYKLNNYYLIQDSFFQNYWPLLDLKHCNFARLMNEPARSSSDLLKIPITLIMLYALLIPTSNLKGTGQCISLVPFYVKN